MQTINIKLGKQLEFSLKVFLTLSGIFTLFTIISTRFNIQNITIIFEITLFTSLIFIYLDLLKNLNFRPVIKQITFYKDLLISAIDTSLLSNAANLIELLPYLLLISELSLKDGSSLSLAFQIYFTAIIYPFNFYVRKKFIIDKFPETFSPLKVIKISKKIILSSILFVSFSELIIYLLNYSDISLLDNFKPILYYLSLLLICLPLTTLRVVLTTNIYSSSLKCLPMIIVFCIVSSIVFVLPNNNLLTNNTLLCLVTFEALFISSILFGGLFNKKFTPKQI